MSFVFFFFVSFVFAFCVCERGGVVQQQELVTLYNVFNVGRL